jgi:hypothetical protein
MFTIFVIMAIVTTATTAPVLWAIWLRHNKLHGEEAFNYTQNYLTDTLDPDFSAASKIDPGYDAVWDIGYRSYCAR